ncbi:hypothetical protein [Rhodococcus sp. Q]|uniref:hypothetical protein n=1 Tax=Rhodococcus sp. Q TaxID=2502252 RepID=UPI0010F814BE|nr:hypothetical protein [Rhodococcus sp. Q]
MNRDTHRIQGHLTEVAPEVFLIGEDDALTIGGTIGKAMYSFEEYDGDATIEVSDDLVAEAEDLSSRFAAGSRKIRVAMMKHCRPGTY